MTSSHARSVKQQIRPPQMLVVDRGVFPSRDGRAAESLHCLCEWTMSVSRRELLQWLRHAKVSKGDKFWIRFSSAESILLYQDSIFDHASSGGLHSKGMHACASPMVDLSPATGAAKVLRPSQTCGGERPKAITF